MQEQQDTQLKLDASDRMSKPSEIPLFITRNGYDWDTPGIEKQTPCWHLKWKRVLWEKLARFEWNGKQAKKAHGIRIKKDWNKKTDIF